MGKMGVIISGSSGLPSGASGGGSGVGRSAAMLYQRVGILSSVSR